MKKFGKFIFLIVLMVILLPLSINAEEVDSGFSSNELIKNRSKVEISILDDNYKSSISNVEFDIQDEDGNVLYKATSTEEVYVIDQLEQGTYYYVEKTVPEGYELQVDKVKFIIEEKDTFVNIRIPHLLSEKSTEVLNKETTILIGVAMFDIAIGIGIIIYVKKNKNKK